MKQRSNIRIAILTLLTLAAVVPSVHGQTDDQLLDTLQHNAFNFFWNQVNVANGLIRDRNEYSAAASIASTGFGLSSICIAIDHGWITRDAGRTRILTALRTFWQGPQGPDSAGTIGYKGFFYHFLDMTFAKRTWNSELSSIDTGLLLAGILDARQYFSTADSLDQVLRALADSIYRRVDWDWMRNSGPGIAMGWMPGTYFSGFGVWQGYNEAMIMNILALGSPTHPVPASVWSYWTSGYSWQTWYGNSFVAFPPLFGHQYSHCWIDFRNIDDTYMRAKGITYFENSRRATLAQRVYCSQDAPASFGYNDSLWGLTACDGPSPAGYSARGAPPAQNDDGTIAPTAAAGSLPFAPDVCIPALRNMYNTYRSQLWTGYGFRDAFNLKSSWWDPDVIGIDEGPIVIMIENYRTQKVWNRFMQNTDVQNGLVEAGFQPLSGVVEREPDVPPGFALSQNYPNPFNPETVIEFTVPAGAATVSLRIYDTLGREVSVLVNGRRAPGQYSVRWDASAQASGVYYCSLRSGSTSLTRPLLLLK